MVFLFPYQRYLTIKKMSPAERKKVNKRVVFFAGKAAPACESKSL
jgi:glucan phosphorylase